MRLEREHKEAVWDDVVGLFREVGWGERDPREVRAAFERSTFRVFAFDGEALVGFGRTIDDGRFYATIVDVVVAPAHQRQGIGTAIVQDLQSRLTGFLVVTLTAAPEAQRFYRRMGWRRQTTAMMFPRSPEQAALNCERGIE